MPLMRHSPTWQVPLMRLSLRLVNERRCDKIGHATILGAEGAPPVITLKLMDWEVTSLLQ